MAWLSFLDYWIEIQLQMSWTNWKVKAINRTKDQALVRLAFLSNPIFKLMISCCHKRNLALRLEAPVDIWTKQPMKLVEARGLPWIPKASHQDVDLILHNPWQRPHFVKEAAVVEAVVVVIGVVAMMITFPMEMLLFQNFSNSFSLHCNQSLPTILNLWELLP